MITRLNNWLAKRWLQNHRIKLSQGISTIPKNAQLILEEGISINVKEMHFTSLAIGAMTYIRSGGELWNVSEIGRFCSISNNVILGQEKGSQSHPLHWLSTHPFQMNARFPPPETEPVDGTVIGHDVWIGRDVMVMEGVTVGTGAVIASRSLVTHDVPEYAIVAGSPARVIRYRHPPELISELLASRWWNIAPQTLCNFPLGDPAQCVKQINESLYARYRAVLLTREHWKLVD